MTWTTEVLAEGTSLFAYDTKRNLRRIPVWPLVASAATVIVTDYVDPHRSEIGYTMQACG
jgi:hypothetical protein